MPRLMCCIVTLQISMNVTVIHVNMEHPAIIKLMDFNVHVFQGIVEYTVKLVR